MPAAEKKMSPSDGVRVLGGAGALRRVRGHSRDRNIMHDLRKNT
jgi:hypothetical protein